MKKKTKQNIILFLMSFILGILLIVNINQDADKYREVSLKSVQMIRNEIGNYEKEISDLSKFIEEKNKEIQKYETSIKEEGNIIEVIKDEIEDIKFIAGFKDTQGPGIIVTISDSESDFEYGENISDFLVHDIDVQRLVNDLKIAGAEAISVSGQRVLSTSEIECNGPTIKINDRTYPIPFVIKAIGDPKVLNAAVSAPGTYGFKLKDIYGIRIKSNISNFLYIPKYNKGYISFRYAKPVKEGE